MKVTRDLTDYGYKKEEEKAALESEIAAFDEMGFISDVFYDNDILTAEVEGTKDKLNQNHIFTNKVSVVKEYYESEGYTCEVE